MASADDPLEQLRAALREAGADQFAGVMADDLGARMRSATDRLIERGAGPQEPELRHFRGGLERFEERGRQDRCRVVAHGLRLCMAIAGRLADLQPVEKQKPKPDLGRRPVEPTPIARGKKPAPKPTPKPAPERALEPEPEPDTELIAGLRAAAKLRQSSVEGLPGVGKKTAEKLAVRGLATIEDLAYLLPLGYEDRRQLTALADVQEGAAAVIEGVVRQFRQGWFSGRYSATLRIEQTQQNGAQLGLEAKWFHPVGGLGQRVETGQLVVLAGVVKSFRGKLSMVHPDVLEPANGLGISLRYPIVEGVGQKTIQRLCQAAVERLQAAGLRDPLPPELVAAHGLVSQVEALSLLHNPPEQLSPEELERLIRRDSPAHRRLAFDEFFFLQLALLRQRGLYRSAPCVIAPLALGSFDRERLRACLPWEPTNAQWRVIREIELDLGKAGSPASRGAKPMLRLLQGDVGSGKTAVAFASALAVIDAGAQAALMAPTEILAEQHLRSLKPWAERAGVRIALLTGSTPRAQRTSLLALLGAGEIDLLVGTHALLVEGVEFARLALVVVDEQHRFGVEQRGALRQKGEAPHLLVMTATPIPRSLALTAFGELDVSIIDELPPGRIAPVTKVYAGPRSLGRARAALVERVRVEDKAYVVCPLVEASEAVDASDVEATAAALRKLLPQREIAVIHGRMLSKDKDAVMQRFRSGAIQVLVATTVIEVGVDVPDARVILIEHAERFGLAQLHQLRGRVGRSQETSICLLHTASEPTSEAGARLEVLERSSDGFVVAERDLELRGPGELFGTKQSGVPRLRLASFSGEGMKMLIAAREAALAIIERDPRLRQHPALRLELELRTGDAQLWAGESG